MHFSLRLSLALGAFSLTNTNFAQVPYVETAALTLQANFNVTGITSTTPTGPIPTPGDNPGSINLIERIATEIGRPIIYSSGNGDQAFFVKHLQRKILEKYSENLRLVEERLLALSIARNTDEPEEGAEGEGGEELGPDDLQLEIDTLSTELPLLQERLETLRTRPYRSWLREELFEREIARIQKRIESFQFALDTAGIATEEEAALAARAILLRDHILYMSDPIRLAARWELTAVRAPQASVQEASHTPYKIFLTVIDPVNAGRPALTYDTDLILQPLQTAGNTTETLVDGIVSKATGSVNTYFRFAFTSLYATDPLYESAGESLAEKTFLEDYSTIGEYWRYEAFGYMTYSIRSTPGPVAAVTQSKMNITGTGWWYHQTYDTANIYVSYNGTAPTRMKMGPTKYQNRILFGEFNVEE